MLDGAAAAPCAAVPARRRDRRRAAQPRRPTCDRRLPRARRTASTCRWCALAYGRSGDKGDTSNIGVIARRPALLPVLRAQVTPERVWRSGSPTWCGARCTRYELPGIDAINFVCEQALDGGGMASLRNDPLGKGMAQILLSMPVRVPAGLLADGPASVEPEPRAAARYGALRSGAHRWGAARCHYRYPACLF